MNDSFSSNNGRLCAVRCLVKTEKGGYSNLIFKQYSDKLDQREVRLAAVLFYGTLERMLTLDSILDPLVKKGIRSLDPEIRAILRIGLYQLLFTDGIPDRAAVNESVNLCRKTGKSSASGLVNAVLHKCIGIGLPLSDGLERYTDYSVCPELFDLLKKQYPDRYRDILNGFFNKKPAVIGTNTLKISSDLLIKKLSEEGIILEAASIPDTFFVKDGSYLNTASFKEGYFTVQSLSSRQAVVSLDPHPGERVLDICAAPGGKSIFAAMLMENSGRIDSVDIHPHRVKLISDNSEKYGASIINPVVSDALSYDTDVLYDRVLCDVPCAGYGEISSKPELRYKTPGNDDDDLFRLQYSILEKGWSLLSKGGRLVYSTCSIDRRENDLQIDRFLRNNHDVRFIEELSHVYLPDTANAEGFFIATFERL